ncbi:MAG: hypothetical protein JO325_09240 [Solirubrobacterales bacterium]|nr:hypothetical protein [Solirubrobacterales bacterium]
MNAHVTYTLARQRSTELQRAGHRARLANEARSTSPDRQLTPSARPAPRSPRGLTALQVEPGIGSEQ